MPYIGNSHIAGDHTNNFKVLDDISSFTATFDGSASSVVDTTNNTIRVVEHRFIQGQRVTYHNGGGSNIGGVSGTAYFVIFDSASTIKLATTASNAASSTAINLSAVGTGSSHTLNAAFDGVNKQFKITYDGGTSARLNNATQLNVAINNVLQKPNNDAGSFSDGFAILDNHKIVFQTAPVSGDIFWGSIIANTLTTFDISDHKIDTFTGDGSTTEFTLSHTPANNESLMVTINGVLQHPSNASTARAYTLIASIIQFTAAPANGDEIQVRHIGFAGATTADVSGFYGRTGNVALTANDHITVGDIPTVRNINASGIITASQFVGNLNPNIGGSNANFTGIVTAGTFKGGDFDGRNLNISGIATFAGNVSIGGTLTYEDVTNIDSIGIITARDGIDCNADLDVDGHTNLDNVSVSGITTFSGIIDAVNTPASIRVAQDIQHKGDANTKISFPSADTITFETAGDERLRINSSGQLIMTNAATQTFADFSTTNNNTRAIIKMDGKTSGGDTVSLRMGGFGDTGRGEIFTQSNHGLGFATNNAATQMLLDTGGRLRIGNTSVTTSNKADDLIVGTTSGHRGITIFSGTGDTGNIYFGDTSTSGVENRMGTITYVHSQNYMRFSTSGNQERLRISGTGELTNTAIQADVATFTSNQTASTIYVKDTDGDGIFISGSSAYGHRIYTNTTEDLLLGTNSSERLRITSDGKFGVGTNADIDERIHFENAGNITVLAECNTTGSGANAAYRLKSADSSSDWYIQTGNVTGGGLRFYSGSERLRINSNGKVGINTTTDSMAGVTGNLNIANDNYNHHTVINLSRNTINDRAQIRFQNPNGNIGSINTLGSDFAIYAANDIIFGASNGDERLRITSDGDVLINQPAQQSGRLTIKGTNSNGSTCYAITNSGKALEGIDITCTTVGDGNYGGAISLGCGGNGRSAIAAVQDGGDDDKNGLAFFTHSSTTGSDNNLERLRITSTGNVGIGTDPSYDVDIRNGTSARVAIDVTTGSDAAIWMDGMDADFAGSDYWGLKAQSSGEFAIFRAASEKLRITTGGAVTLSGTTTSARNAGISTSTGSIIYNSTVDLLQVYTGTVWKNVRFGQSGDFNISYLVVGGGGGGGGYFRGGGGGAGALRTNWNNESQGGGQSSGDAKTITAGIAYSIIVGSGGSGNYNTQGSSGGTSTFDDIVSKGGGGGGRYHTTDGTEDGGSSADPGGGSGGAGGGAQDNTHVGQGGASGTYGYDGGDGSPSPSTQCGGGGGGAASAGNAGGGGGTDGDGGAALANTISGSSVDYAGGAGGGNYGGGNTTIGGGAGAPAGSRGSASSPGADASIPNRGSGGGGAGGANVSGGAGSSGVIILRFSSLFTASFSNGVTHSSVTNGGETIVTITATSDSSQTVTFV